MRVILVLIFCLMRTFAHSQESPKLQTKSKDLVALDTDLNYIPVLVKVVSTCSIKPELCGYLVFASTSLVMPLEGKYKNQKIYVSLACQETNYKVNAFYSLYLMPESGSAQFCDELTYDPNWKFTDWETKYPMVFGRLE